MFDNWKQMILKTLGWLILGCLLVVCVVVVSAVVWAFLCEMAHG